MATEEAEAAGAAAAGEAMVGGEARRGGGGEEAFPRAYVGNGEPSPDPAAAPAGAFAAAIRDGTGEGMRTGGDAGRAYGLSLSPSCNGFAEAERAALRRLLGE